MSEEKKLPEDKLIQKPFIPFALEIKGPLKETQIALLVKALGETVSKFLVDNTTIKKYTRISSERQELNKAKQYSQTNDKLKKTLEDVISKANKIFPYLGDGTKANEPEHFGDAISSAEKVMKDLKDA